MSVKSQLTATAAAALLEISTERFQRLVDEGYVKVDGSDRVDVASAIMGYIQALRHETERSSQSALASRVRAAQARRVELRNAQTDGVLFDLEESHDILAEIFGGVKSALYGVPAMTSRDLEVRRRIETELDAILTKVADTLEAWGRSTPDDADTGAGVL